jgi:hypothetical protein
VRFTDGGSPGQPPAEEELNLTEEEMRVRTAALDMLHPPAWVEYMDGIAVLVVLLTGFLVTSERYVCVCVCVCSLTLQA